MRRRLTVAMLCVGAASCRAEPQVGGASLYCDSSESGSGCPEGMRCEDGACVFNSPPVLGSFEHETRTVGSSLSVRVEVRDADGDTVELTWVQTAGPPISLGLGDEPESGTEVELSLSAVGSLAFEVTAFDGHDRSDPAGCS